MVSSLAMTSSPARSDVAVVGGGIVGLAVADALLTARPGLKVVLLEAEDAVCRHQTGHNSGVIHSGLYYKPGSLKARLAVSGAARMQRFCEEQGIEVQVCGKVVVATDDVEEGRMATLLARGQANGVPGIEQVGRGRLHELQPGVAGQAALWVPGAAITDFSAVGAALAQRVDRAGGQVRTGARVDRCLRTESEWRLEGPAGDVRAGFLVGCAGLHSDRLAQAAGERPDVRIVPFRGEYRVLSADKAAAVRRLVYPVPDPALPFLGVHLTPQLDGGVHVGPNAVLALSRAGYHRGVVSVRDTLQTLMWPGFWRMALVHGRTGIAEEARSWFRSLMARDLRRMLPGVAATDLRPGGAGVRAQALSRSGALLDDFALLRADGALHVLNAPSPAATASLAIGDEVAAAVLACLT